MWRCCRLPAICASWKKRLRTSCSSELQLLMATKRRMWGSKPLKMVPKPPSPIFSTTSYFPMLRMEGRRNVNRFTLQGRDILTRGSGGVRAAPRRMTEALMPPLAAASATRWASHLECARTGVTAPLDEPASLSPAGAPWLVRYALDGRDGAAWRRALGQRTWGLWRYRELLPVADFERRVGLAQGGTPLVPLRRLSPAGVQTFVKEEAGNPTGSFKARGMAMAITRAREFGLDGVELASAGNAALAACAYGAAAGMRVRVAMPADTPPAIPALSRLRRRSRARRRDPRRVARCAAVPAGRPLRP